MSHGGLLRGMGRGALGPMEVIELVLFPATRPL